MELILERPGDLRYLGLFVGRDPLAQVVPPDQDGPVELGHDQIAVTASLALPALEDDVEDRGTFDVPELVGPTSESARVAHRPLPFGEERGLAPEERDRPVVPAGVGTSGVDPQEHPSLVGIGGGVRQDHVLAILAENEIRNILGARGRLSGPFGDLDILQPATPTLLAKAERDLLQCASANVDDLHLLSRLSARTLLE